MHTHTDCRVQGGCEAGVGAVWTRKTICIMYLLPGETETLRWGGAGFLTSALSPTDAPTDTWCPHRPRGRGKARPGAPGPSVHQNQPLELRPAGSLVSPWDEHTAAFSPGASLSLAQCVSSVWQGESEK